MERYNISDRRPPQALPLIAALAETPKSARWPNALPKNRPSAASAGAAVLLHVAVGLALLTFVRLPAAPELPGEQTVALVFAPPQSVSPEPLAPAATLDPPLPAEIPAPPELPVAPPTPPEPPPPPSPAETKSSDAPPPITRPPVAHKTTPRAKPVAPPHIAETPTTSQPHPRDAPASQSASRSPVAEAPVASEWQRSLATWLAAHKNYPDEARRRGTEGNVVLRFTVDRSGHVVDVVLVRGAGSSLLDAAAEAMVRNAMLPPFTAGMSQDTITITVQIRYALTD
jgi:protein TonB